MGEVDTYPENIKVDLASPRGSLKLPTGWLTLLKVGICLPGVRNETQIITTES